MKKAIILAVALVAGVTLAGNPAEIQAATVKNTVIKKVATANGSTLQDCLAQLTCGQWGNITVITIPCIPGIGGTPDANEPESKPDTDVPQVPDTNEPESKPDMNVPQVPDTDVPQVPGTNVPQTPDANEPESKPDTNVPQMPENGDVQAEYDANVLRVVELVNEERVKAGLSPLTLQKNIAAAAQVRAVETETRFSHTRPDGSSFSTALTQAGVSYRGYGENIAWGQRTPEQVMNGWMNSAGHRANILNASYTSIGVGYYQNASGTNYWTQLFTY